MPSPWGTMTQRMATSDSVNGPSDRPSELAPSENGGGRTLAVRELAWAALLGRWIEFAKASVALPTSGDGARWRASIAPFIELQAIVWALRELAEIPVADRPFARDRAEMQVRRAGTHLDEAWRGVPMPTAMLELLDDATIALRESIYAGLVELIWPGPGVLEVPIVETGSVEGTLALMPPGSLAMPGEPVAWFTERDAVVVPGCVARPAKRPTQVYRSLDARGRFVRDTVAPLEHDTPSGLPMLVAISIAGTAIGRFTHDVGEWLQLQRQAMGDRQAIDVVWVAEAD